MSKFTASEIALCKKIAEYEKREIVYGDWFLLNNKLTLCAYSNDGWRKRMEENIIPLWTLSDCLAWLSQKEGVIEVWRTGITLKWICRLKNHKWRRGKTPLEACLKAILQILEGGKG